MRGRTAAPRNCLAAPRRLIPDVGEVIFAENSRPLRRNAVAPPPIVAWGGAGRVFPLRFSAWHGNATGQCEAEQSSFVRLHFRLVGVQIYTASIKKCKDWLTFIVDV